MAIFVIRHDLPRNSVAFFEGMSQDQISEMYRNGNVSFDFIDEKTYTDFIAAQKAEFVDPNIAIKKQAVLDAKNKSKMTDLRLDALIKALGLE